MQITLLPICHQATLWLPCMGTLMQLQCVRLLSDLPAAEFRSTPSRVKRPARRASTEAKQAAPEALIL
jgi:hypothetical protein